jgi:hypothetical protein
MIVSLLVAGYLSDKDRPTNSQEFDRLADASTRSPSSEITLRTAIFSFAKMRQVTDEPQ